MNNQLTNNQININNNLEINTLRKILKPEVRKAKGQNLVNTYIRIIEKKYESILDDYINSPETNKIHKNNRTFQKIIENKQNSKLISKKDLLTNTKSFSIYNNKISTSKSSLNISPIKMKKIQENNDEEKKQNTNINLQNTFWKDLEYLNFYSPINKKNENNENIENKNNINNKKNTSQNKKSLSVENINKKKDLEKYYLYLLNRRKKIYESEETNEDRQKEKIEVEILRQIFEKLYDEDEKLKKKLEDKNIPEFYKRFIIQEEIKKDNIFIKKFKNNYKESQNLKGPNLCNNSRLICENSLNYEPIYKRFDKVILNKEKKLKKMKDKLAKNKNEKNTKKKKKMNASIKKWLKSMDNWYEKKMKKIQDKKIQIEKNDPNKKECKFKPNINTNAKIKKEDEGLLCCDRLYLEYFSIRQKKKKMLEEEKNFYTFRPNLECNKK